MPGLNRVILTGRLTRDPELRFTKDEIPVAKFSVAVNGFKRKGAEKEPVDFFNCVAWRGLAKIVGEYLKKGSLVAIEGKMHIKSYTGKDNIERKDHEIVVDNMLMLDSKKPSGAKAAEPCEEYFEDSNVPF